MHRPPASGKVKFIESLTIKHFFAYYIDMPMSVGNIYGEG